MGPQLRAPTPKANKIIPLLAIIPIVLGLQAATQFFAYEFNYQLALGSHFKHLYPPWAIVQWAGLWYGQFQNGFMRAGGIGITIAAAGLLGLVTAQMVLENTAKANLYLHGSARWANLKDIQTAGLLPKPRTMWQTVTGKQAKPIGGVYVGAWLDKQGKQHYLRHNGPEHILCYALTRSGKGVGLPR